MQALAAAVKALPADRAKARKVFVIATEDDPAMADGWLGRVAAGDRSLATLGRLAELCGLDAAVLQGTVDRYNAAVEAGTPQALQPPRSTAAGTPRPIRSAPFYAIPVCAGITYTMGGIAIDADARVLTPRGDAIAGLYAVGCCTGGLEGGPAVGYVGGLVKSGVTGLRAGEHIAGASQPLPA